MDILQRFRAYISIGFRVEVYDQNPYNNNATLKDGCMVPRSLLREGDMSALHDHLSWIRRPGPFISFFANWYRALAWRNWLIRSGAREVVLVAVWLKNLPVYDAFRIAGELGFDHDSCGYHIDEYLVYGGIAADDYRILATFHGINDTERVAFALGVGTFDARIPMGLIEGDGEVTDLAGSLIRNGTPALRREIYTSTGEFNDIKLHSLVFAICQVRYLRV